MVGIVPTPWRRSGGIIPPEVVSFNWLCILEGGSWRQNAFAPLPVGARPGAFPVKNEQPATETPPGGLRCRLGCPRPGFRKS